MSRTVKFSVPKIVVALAMTIGAGVAFVSAGAHAADPKCADLTIAKVKAACEKGGIPEVKKLMKAAADKAKVKCIDCHVSATDFGLKDKDKNKKDLEANLP